MMPPVEIPHSFRFLSVPRAFFVCLFFFNLVENSFPQLFIFFETETSSLLTLNFTLTYIPGQL